MGIRSYKGSAKAAPLLGRSRKRDDDPDERVHWVA